MPPPPPPKPRMGCTHTPSFGFAAPFPPPFAPYPSTRSPPSRCHSPLAIWVPPPVPPPNWVLRKEEKEK
ncbi:hypothetical protein TIFTF001_009972 [Ficus carica]|uniref:Uncharacterized protein n=1 Tax=Ficus carica TaxID=3494 RepID=A0AA88A7U2_FICCA|nr:hypothetical protein TIFTF001_009972 [Ficus carica]